MRIGSFSIEATLGCRALRARQTLDRLSLPNVKLDVWEQTFADLGPKARSELKAGTFAG